MEEKEEEERKKNESEKYDINKYNYRFRNKYSCTLNTAPISTESAINYFLAIFAFVRFFFHPSLLF